MEEIVCVFQHTLSKKITKRVPFSSTLDLGDSVCWIWGRTCSHFFSLETHGVVLGMHVHWPSLPPLLLWPHSASGKCWPGRAECTGQLSPASPWFLELCSPFVVSRSNHIDALLCVSFFSTIIFFHLESVSTDWKKFLVTLWQACLLVQDFPARAKNHPQEQEQNGIYLPTPSQLFPISQVLEIPISIP